MLNGTSKFGVSDKTDKTFDPLCEFNAQRSQWNQESFGKPTENPFTDKSPKVRQAVLLDFNESIDDAKLRKFE